jgi:hypothetical protein
MCDVDSCRTQGCKQKLTYGFASSSDPIRCKAHRDPRMIYVLKARCKFPGCTRIPHFNVPGSTVGLYCGEHRVEEMVNLNHRRCHGGPLGQVCMTRPKFNYPNQAGRGVCCAAHKEDGMVDVISDRCADPLCQKRAAYGWNGQLKYCSAHKLDGMCDSNHRLCTFTGCSIRATFGFPGVRPTRCFKHSELGQLAHPRRPCEHELCTRIATWGIHSPERCEFHRTLVDRDLVLKRCAGCQQPSPVLSVDSCCDLCTTLLDHVRLRRQREIRAVLDRQSDSLSRYLLYDTRASNCSGIRPDFLWESESRSHLVIVEVDEDQHRTYDPSCERARMINLTQELHVPCVFIRYNPDPYRGQPTSFRDLDRQAYLCEVIRHCLSLPPINDSLHILRVIYLFFDGFVPSLDVSRLPMSSLDMDG